MCFLFFLLLSIHCIYAQPLPVVKPEVVGMQSDKLNQVDEIILDAISKKQIPGAVILVGRQGQIVKRHAFGKAQLVPTEKPMTTDHIFDLASMTKPIATATAIMILVEEGKVRLLDRVSEYIPEFSTYFDSSTNEKEPARIYHLLTHTAGLPAYTDATKVKAKFGEVCPDSLILHIARLKKITAPGKKFTYSCLGYMTLGEIVKRVSGMPLDKFTVLKIFKPLKMDHTCFCPPDAWNSRIVPTQVFDGKPLTGIVHDPLAQLMGGVSGNAGLFSTVDDLAIFSQMMLQDGTFQDVQVLNSATVKVMTRVYHEVPVSGRGLGWDIQSDYASQRGDLFSVGGYGHTGYTGTSIWIDPKTQTFLIFLTNRVHPDDKGSIVRLRSCLANMVAAAIIE
ncbi:serine hydrolase [candidate division KSB1 bacterium]|nr:serine hydrolase [candidate division KSB1 bacterium]